ncbi:glycosyltransferase family 4 protein [Phycisphaerales bacterium AB-hyl4]|uniref:Glycosyltransferase family 4 protein n=1 Tax=Natronomicrosphaera hydrolytica TaxID=3242702 RepID=A0ABV4U674_9BACT
MPLAYLTGEYPRATDTFVQREIAHLRALGRTVHTFAARRPDPHEIVGPEQQAERDNTTYLVPPQPIHLITSHFTMLARAPRRYLATLRLAWRTAPPGLRDTVYQLLYFAEAATLARHLQQRKIQHLHNHFANSSCTVAMLAAALADIPFSFTMHGPAIFFEPRRWRIDEKIRRARFVACISHFCRSQAMIFAPPDTWPRLHIVHCGVDPQQFTPVRHTAPGRRLLFVGRLAAVKGIPVLFHAMQAIVRRCPDAQLTLAGDGRERPQLEQHARDLGLTAHVRFVGYQSQANVRDLLHHTDVFVLPSFAEGVPVVLMEAMATAVPVVATRIAGVAELVVDNTVGYLVNPGCPDTLADRVVDLLTDPDKRQRMGDAGRAIVQRDFNIGTEATRLHHLFNNATADVTTTKSKPTVSHRGPAPAPQ